MKGRYNGMAMEIYMELKYMYGHSQQADVATTACYILVHVQVFELAIGSPSKGAWGFCKKWTPSD